MPWTVADVDRFRTGLSAEQKAEWVKIANSALASCQAEGGGEECDARAIRVANGNFASESEKARRRLAVLEYGSPFPSAKTDGRTIQDAKLLGIESRGKGYGYSGRGLDVAHASGSYIKRPVYLSHAEDGSERHPRDLAGHIVETRRRADGLYGDIETISTQAGRDLLAIAAEAPHAGGMSHHAHVTFNQDETAVESIDEVISVDFVVSPATTRTLFESAGRPRNDAMAELKSVAELRTSHPALVREIEEATRNAIESSADSAKAKAEHEAAVKERDELKRKVALAESREAVEAAIREAKDLPNAVAERVREITKDATVTKEQAQKLVASERDYAAKIARESGGGVEGAGAEDDSAGSPDEVKEARNVIRGAIFRACGIHEEEKKPAAKRAAEA